jgi:hypothetical protein
LLGVSERGYFCLQFVEEGDYLGDYVGKVKYRQQPYDPRYRLLFYTAV